MLRHRATDPLPARDRGHHERSIRDVCAATIVVRLQNIRAEDMSILYGHVSIHSRPEPICQRVFAGNLRIDGVSISSSDDLVENLQNRFAIAFGCAADFYFHWSDFGSQKGPVRPIEAKIDTISSAAGRRDSTVSRFPYHVTARCQSWSRLINGRRGMLCAAHQRPTVSSDRKRSMVAQVNTISSHQCAAGTAKCAMYGFRTGSLFLT